MGILKKRKINKFNKRKVDKHLLIKSIIILDLIGGGFILNIYNFNKNINGLNNINEGEYTNFMLSNIENDIANELNMEFDSKNPYTNKEIKF